MRRNKFFVPLLAALSLAAFVLPALSASAAGLTEYVESEYQVARAADGTPVTKIIETVVSPTGQVLRSNTTMSQNPRFAAKAELPFACAHDGYRSGFMPHKTQEDLYRGKNDFVQFLFFPYSSTTRGPRRAASRRSSG